MTSRSMPMPSPAGRRHAVFERADVVLVHRVRFGIARGPFGQLRLEAAALLGRIVQLAERVRHLESADVQLEPLDRVGIVLPLLGQRRDFGRKVVDERRLDELVLPQVLEDLGRDLPGTAPSARCNAEPFGEGPRAVEARSSSASTARRAAARPPPPPHGAATGAGTARARSIVCSPNGTCSDPAAAARHERQQLLGELHEHLIVHVGPIELEHRELGVVLRRDALIPEVTIDLEHRSMPPTVSRLRYSSGAMRRYSFMSSAL